MIIVKVTLNEIKEMAHEAVDQLWEAAEEAGHDNPKIYLHWTAGHYGQFFNGYHLLIDHDGAIYASTDDLSEVLQHTWKRNTGSIGIALCCCAGGNTSYLGYEPPTEVQISMTARVVAILCGVLGIPLNINGVLTHGEAADICDGDTEGYDYDEAYGPQNGCERWDLQYLGTSESPEYTADHSNPATGGNVIRKKALSYLNGF